MWSTGPQTDQPFFKRRLSHKARRFIKVRQSDCGWGLRALCAAAELAAVAAVAN